MLLLEKDKIIKIIVSVVLLLLFLSTGSFKLAKIPPTLNQDEMSFSLGAKKISETRYDLCDNKLPLFPCQLKEMPYRGVTLSYYLTASFYKLYPPADIFDIRIFSVLIGVITGIFSFFFFYKLMYGFKNKFWYSLVFSIIFYLSIGIFTIQRFGAPYYILSILLQLLLFYLIYIFWITKNKKYLFFIPMAAALLMLDYQVYRLFAPLYLLFFILIFKNELKNKYFLGGLAIFSVFFYLVLFQTLSDTYFTTAYLGDKGVKLWQLLLHYYSFTLFYFKYNITFFTSSRYGLFQNSTIIFFLFGLVWIFKNIKQNKFFQFILLSLATYPLAAIATKEPYVTNRIINLIPIYFIIVVYGFIIFIKLTELSQKKIFSLLHGALLILMLLQSFYFLYDYFFITSKQNNYCRIKSMTGHNCNFIGLFDYLQNKNYDKIYFDSSLVFIGSYIDFYNKIMDYKIKNYEIVDINNNILFKKDGILIISKDKSKSLQMEQKYDLFYKIKEPNINDSFFYIFKVNKL